VVSPTLTLGSFGVAILVGLTGMGGGALLTPMLMLAFGVPPLAAVSSDLVASAITRPIGAFVHLRRGTVHLRLAGWLSAGSVPSAIAGGLIGWWAGPAREIQAVTERATGAVLVLAAIGIVARTARSSREGSSPARGGEGGGSPMTAPAPDFFVRKIPTIIIGIMVGLAVGITSTGSGTLVLAALSALYPALPAGRLVGTDLAQAVPMIFAAALAHVIAGDVHLAVTAPLLLGGVPGIIVGSLLAPRVPGGLLRAALSVLILASGLSLIGLAPAATVLVTLAGALPVGALMVRHRSRTHAPGDGNMAAEPPLRDSQHPGERSARDAA
jgi:uncharacterized membrane protein YfcA